MIPPFAVFVDFDGTITDVDTFALLVRDVAGDGVWTEIDEDLLAQRITFREALRREAQLIRLSRPAALALLESRAHVDPEFAPFVRRVRASGGTIAVVSAGIATIIRATLARSGLGDIDVIANDVDFHGAGWNMSFVDDSVFGHDKTVHVRAAAAAGFRTVYCGDGFSDFPAIELADRAFVKADSALETYCIERGVPSTPFTSFGEVEAALFQ